MIGLFKGKSKQVRYCFPDAKMRACALHRLIKQYTEYFIQWYFGSIDCVIKNKGNQADTNTYKMIS